MRTMITLIFIVTIYIYILCYNVYIQFTSSLLQWILITSFLQLDFITSKKSSKADGLSHRYNLERHRYNQ